MPETPHSIASIGECMVEIFVRDGGTCALGYGGDTLNTATYLRRILPAARAHVSYVTALGDDPYSEEMLARWRAEGLDTSLIARLPGRLPGLYTIRTDDAGERSFHYWRNAAAARDLMRAPDIDRISEAVEACDLVYVSGITLSIYDQESRDRLHDLLDRVRTRGGKVAFDGNYRPRGWPDIEAAQQAAAAVLTRTDIALPTFDDEHALYGDADPEATIARLHGHGVREIVVKRDRASCLLVSDEGRSEVPTEPVARPVDTTAAGDSFNAGYLAARLLGASAEVAARAGHTLAGTVIQHPGAIIPTAEMPDLGLA